ncbi:MAG: hypothetical protein C1943_18645 [Halochromatium sp.]|nr:hypothetical protein [Halochromatium sp.]
MFRTAAQLTGEGFVREGTDWLREDARFVPLYEAKMIHQFDYRWAGYAENGSDSVDVGLAEKGDPDWEPAPRYWVPEAEVTARLAAKGWTRGWLMGWRDICLTPNILSALIREPQGQVANLLGQRGYDRVCTSLIHRASLLPAEA